MNPIVLISFLQGCVPPAAVAPVETVASLPEPSAIDKRLAVSDAVVDKLETVLLQRQDLEPINCGDQLCFPVLVEAWERTLDGQRVYEFSENDCLHDVRDAIASTISGQLVTRLPTGRSVEGQDEQDIRLVTQDFAGISLDVSIISEDVRVPLGDVTPVSPQLLIRLWSSGDGRLQATLSQVPLFLDDEGIIEARPRQPSTEVAALLRGGDRLSGLCEDASDDAKRDLDLTFRMEIDRGGSTQQVPMSTPVHTDDVVRLLVRSSDPGYLYVMNCGTSGTFRRLSPGVMDGSNYIGAYSEVSVAESTIRGEPGTEELFVHLSPTRNVALEVVLRELEGSQCRGQDRRPFIQSFRDSSVQSKDFDPTYDDGYAPGKDKRDRYTMQIGVPLEEIFEGLGVTLRLDVEHQ